MQSEFVGDPSPVLWRTVGGGFLAPAGGTFGVPARPGTGAFVKLVAPAVVALQGNDLLVLDRGLQRLWRVDLALNTLTPVAGAPTDANTAVALAPDLSAWVLDVASRQVLRFARDGRLMQTQRPGFSAPAPTGLALVDGGAALLLADGTQGRWAELRGVGAFATEVALRSAEGAPLAARIDAIAATREAVFALDRGAARVYRARRDGVVLEVLGECVLRQPAAIAADRFGRVYVVDAFDRAVKVLRSGAPTLTWPAQQLRVQGIGGIAVDDRFLAIADPLGGQVAIHDLHGELRR